jgi:hypothetical protein
MKNFLSEIIRLSKAPGFSQNDAETVRNILSELDTSDKGLRKQMLKRLKDIYILNYHKVKQTRQENTRPP